MNELYLTALVLGRLVPAGHLIRTLQPLLMQLKWRLWRMKKLYVPNGLILKTVGDVWFIVGKLANGSDRDDFKCDVGLLRSVVKISVPVFCQGASVSRDRLPVNRNQLKRNSVPLPHRHYSSHISCHSLWSDLVAALFFILTLCLDNCPLQVTCRLSLCVSFV